MFKPDEEIVPWPAYSQKLDYELEVGYIISRSGRDIIPEKASDYLLGVTLYNDFSARNYLVREIGAMMGPAKGKDFATALGPWITTVDEVDPHNLTMIARVNDEEWSRGLNSKSMWSIEELIAYISDSEIILAGDILGSGTVDWGCGLELDRFLQPGDVVELEIEGAGVLRNKLGFPDEIGWEPTARMPAGLAKEASLE